MSLPIWVGEFSKLYNSQNEFDNFELFSLLLFSLEILAEKKHKLGSLSGKIKEQKSKLYK